MTRRQGGQPGNKNALKHGLYARRFTKPEISALKKMDPASLEAEIHLLRVVADRILARLEAATDDSDAYTKLTNSLTNAITALNTTARTHALLMGAYTPLDDALINALEELDNA